MWWGAVVISPFFLSHFYHSRPLAPCCRQTNLLSQKCELWRNFSNIFRCENVLSVSECEWQWQCSRKTACLYFVRYGKFMEMSSLAEVAYFSLPCINLEVQIWAEWLRMCCRNCHIDSRNLTSLICRGLQAGLTSLHDLLVKFHWN